jgi:hypothetical protein
MIKRVKDERVTQIKNKIASEAYSIMFLSLLAIVSVKCIILKLPIKEFFTEFVLFLGISFYVIIRMIVSGVYAIDLRNSSKKTELKIAVISDIIFLAVMGTLQYFQNTLNLVFLLCMGISYFLAFCGMIWVSGKIAERYNKTEDDE